MSLDARPDPAVVYAEGLSDGRLLLQYCRCCFSLRYPASSACIDCGSDEYRWVEARGDGTIEQMTYLQMTSEADRHPDTPYAVASVTLHEGTTITARLVGPTIEPRDPVSVTVWEGAVVAHPPGYRPADG